MMGVTKAGRLVGCLAFLALAAPITVIASTEAAPSASGAADNDIDYAQIDLHELTNDELVAVCTQRGFELVAEVDDISGEPFSYSHDDYVEAARECLALEAEMEQFYEENRGLQKDMEDERDRMMKENEELEQQVKEAKDKLERERSRAGEGGGAFAKPHATQNSAEAESDKSDASEDGSSNEAAGVENNEEKEKEHAELKELLDDDSDDVIDLDHQGAKGDGENGGVGNEGLSSHGAQDETDRPVESEAQEISKPETEAEGAPVSHEDGGISTLADKDYGTGPLATARLMKDITLEVREKMIDDFNRVADMILPEPLREPIKEAIGKGFRLAKDAAMRAAEMAQRYAKALFKEAKAAYEKRKQEKEGGVEQ